MVSIRYILIVGLSILTWANSICSQTFTLFTKGESTFLYRLSKLKENITKSFWEVILGEQLMDCLNCRDLWGYLHGVGGPM